MEIKEKEPWVAVILSSLMPGLGQFVFSRKVKGILLFFVTSTFLIAGIFSIIDCSGNTIIGYLLLITYLAIWVFNLFDAFFLAKNKNSVTFERVRHESKDPFLAVFLSSLLPGLGHLYAKRIALGLVLILMRIAYSMWFDYSFVYKITADVVFGVIAYHAFFISRKRNIYFKNIQFLIIVMILISILSQTVQYVGTKYFIGFSVGSGNSSSPTLINGDVALDHLNLRKEKIKRGDFVTIQGGWGVNRDIMAKRVVAFEGEMVEIKGGSIYINGKEITSGPIASIKYTTDSTCIYAKEGDPYEVPQGSVFVLGDNSKESLDSRYFGAVKKEQLLGIVCKIIWPLTRIKKL